MGCFDFECTGCGEQCGDTYVQIRVPLKDGTVVYMDGEYDFYGGVLFENNKLYIKFYNIEDSDFFQCWEDVSSTFIHTGIWCSECRDNDIITAKEVNRLLLFLAIDYQIDN